MATGPQLDLWHESLSDALRAIVEGTGGPKEVAQAMWPTIKDPVEARNKLNNSLNRSHAQKLDLDDIEFLLKWGRDHGVHVGMAYLCNSLNYEPTKPVNPETEKERLQREFINAVQAQNTLVKRMEALANG